MDFSNLKLIVTKTRQDIIKGKQNLLITITVLLFCFLSIGIGFTKYTDTSSKVNEYRKETCERFGSFTSALILQSVVPLILIFLGFVLIVRVREDAPLKY